MECGDAFSAKSTAPVWTYPPNGFGLHDMAGNVHQWVEDKTNDDGASRVLRGGSWFGDAMDLRAAARHVVQPGDRNVNLGFRVCRDSPIEKPVTGSLSTEPPAR